MLTSEPKPHDPNHRITPDHAGLRLWVCTTLAATVVSGTLQSRLADNQRQFLRSVVRWRGLEKSTGKYSPEVAKVKDDRAFVDLASRMMRELKASHLYLSAGQARRVGIGVRTSQLEDQLVVT